MIIPSIYNDPLTTQIAIAEPVVLGYVANVRRMIQRATPCQSGDPTFGISLAGVDAMLRLPPYAGWPAQEPRTMFCRLPRPTRVAPSRAEKIEQCRLRDSRTNPG